MTSYCLFALTGNCLVIKISETFYYFYFTGMKLKSVEIDFCVMHLSTVVSRSFIGVRCNIFNRLWKIIRNHRFSQEQQGDSSFIQEPS